jgi:NAD(P)-dependent dehydrogenase (short-subunit alcohol dehydrogenase family)
MSPSSALTTTTNKVAVVTGGMGALGAAVAQRFAAADYDVHVTTSREPEPPGYQGRGRAHVVDLAKLDNVRAFAQQFERVDALALCAGGFAEARLDALVTRDVDAMLEVNLKTAMHALAAFAEKLVRGAGVVLVGSQSYAGAAGMAAYAASKAGVVSLMQSAALEWKPRRVRVNAVLPDIMDTPANRRAMPMADVNHWARPEDVAEAIFWLCSPAASVVSGNAIKVGV